MGALHDHDDGDAGFGVSQEFNFGCLEVSAPHDLHLYFPGHADGGISGDLTWTANAVNNCQRMPHILTMNPVKQMVPRQQPPDAIINGHAIGYLRAGISQEAQLAPFSYPEVSSVFRLPQVPSYAATSLVCVLRLSGGARG